MPSAGSRGALPSLAQRERRRPRSKADQSNGAPKASSTSEATQRVDLRPPPGRARAKKSSGTAGAAPGRRPDGSACCRRAVRGSVSIVVRITGASEPRRTAATTPSEEVERVVADVAGGAEARRRRRSSSVRKAPALTAPSMTQVSTTFQKKRESAASGRTISGVVDLVDVVLVDQQAVDAGKRARPGLARSQRPAAAVESSSARTDAATAIADGTRSAPARVPRSERRARRPPALQPGGSPAPGSGGTG